VFIGPNSSGKSLIFEALTKFFNEFNPIGGTSAVTDLLWFKRDTSNPIEFEITLELGEEEIKELVPLVDKIISAVKRKFADTFNIIKIKRSLQSNGAWKTNEVKWSQIDLVLDDTLASPEKIQNFIQPLLSLSNYKMYFFTQGYSKENIGGDRLLVNLEEKKGLTSNPVIDDLVKKGLIESSIEYYGKNWQEWAKENNIVVTSPGVTDIAELGIITPEILQRFITQLTKLRTALKLIPAARDMKSTIGLRSSFLDPNLLQGITSTSIDTSSKAFIKWNEYRRYIKNILGKELEPNPTQVRIIDGNVGLFPAHIGGGDQSILGLIWETLEANSIIGIEEPENHLHPRLQRLLLEYLQELSAKTQVMICTHSAIFASKPDISNVFLVSKDAEGATQIEPVSQTNVYRIIDELGVKAGDILDFDTVVFVEGKCDVKIFEGFKLTLLKSEENVGFVDAGGWTSMGYFANAKILRSLRPSRRIFVIFDGDTERNKKIKERLLNELNVKDENIITLTETQIEAYLLVPSAIKRAFPNISLSESEISETIEMEKSKKNKKEILDMILRKGNMGPYDDEKAGSIAKSFLESEISNEIKGIFEKISSKQ
jgi:hypothetical protein